MAKKKKKHPVITAIKTLIGFTIVLLLLLIAGFTFYESQLLEASTTEILSMDIDNDTISQEDRTIGGFQILEDSIREYMTEYVDTLRSIRGLLDEDQYVNLLSIENLQADGPEMTNSIAYLENKKKVLNEACEKLLEMSEEENIMEPIENSGLNKYFEWEYKRNMIDIIQKQFMYSEDEINEAAQSMIDAIDVRMEALQFLKENKDNWHVEDGKISFRTQEMLDQYNALINKVNVG